MSPFEMPTIPEGQGLFQRVPSILPMFEQPTTSVKAPLLPHMPATLASPVTSAVFEQFAIERVAASSVPFESCHTVYPGSVSLAPTTPEAEAGLAITGPRSDPTMPPVFEAPHPACVTPSFTMPVCTSAVLEQSEMQPMV